MTPTRRRHLRDDPEVVGDQQHAHRPLGLQAAQQFENLRLDGHVERRRRLIGDQQARIAGQRDGDHHPLLHAAGQLEGILAEAAFRVGDADRRQQFERPFARRLPARPRWRSSTSPIWRPTVSTGLRLVAGS
jgi:hypothetical protein